MLTLILQKLRKVRMSVPAVVLLVLASYRTLTSGDSIQLVGVCAAIVPFFCIFKNFPKADKEVSAIQDVISSYIVTLVLMLVYLAWILLLTWAGQIFNPNYILNPSFTDMLFISIAADIVFISAVIPVCRELQPMQRMIPGLILTNAMLFFMMMASSFVKTTTLTNIPVIACGFCALVMVLTFSMIFAGYRQPKA
ncbi:MAG: hypothetical protein IJB59_09675 [Oscillospiraceae bacterium]|nr:hypothetical protein [Oscillospiraceae bacterium]